MATSGGLAASLQHVPGASYDARPGHDMGGGRGVRAGYGGESSWLRDGMRTYQTRSTNAVSAPATAYFEPVEYLADVLSFAIQAWA